MRAEQAEILSLQILGWLAGDADLWPVFLGATGADAGDIQQKLASGAVETALLAAVLDFVLMDDGWILRAAEAVGTPPETLMRALHALPGGAPVHWT